MENTYLPAFEYDVLKQKLRAAKADAAKMRNELLAALDKPIKDGLASIELTSEQKQIKTHVLPTAEAAALYNKFAETEAVGGLFHTTC